MSFGESVESEESEESEARPAFWKRRKRRGLVEGWRVYAAVFKEKHGENMEQQSD